MKTLFTVKTATELPDESIMVSGSVEGPFLTRVGQSGYMLGGNVKVLITGIGVVDPTFLTAERQGILIKVLEGNVGALKGVTLVFDEE